MTDKAKASADGKTLRVKTVGQKRFSVRLLRWLVAVVMALVVIHLVFQYFNLLVFDEKHAGVFEFSNRFDFNDESSLPTWFSQALFLVFGVVSLFVAYMTKQRAKKNIWRIIGAIGVLVSVDEIGAFHETILQLLHVTYFGDESPGFLANAWIFVIPIILFLGTILFWQMLKTFPARTVWLFTFGGVLFVAGAVGIDIVTNAIPQDTFLSQGILVALEEGAEMISGAIFLYAAVDYLETYHSSRIGEAFAALSRAKV